MPFPNAAFKRAIRHHSEPITVKRRDDTTSGSYGEPVTYTTLDNKRQLYIAGIEESQQPTDAGENQSRRLAAYSAPNVDIQTNDRVVYNGNTYEVLTTTDHPYETDVAVKRYELEDV